MPRKPASPADIRVKGRDHVKAAERALRTLQSPLSDEDVCYCDEGNDAGITEAECGCQYAEAAKILEAAGCYIRRHADIIAGQ